MNDSIAVIGGGAAGMAAAVKAAWQGAHVTLYEKQDKLGRKLGITGKGRCNVTCACSPKEFLASVTKNDKFMYSAAFRHTPADVYAFFESIDLISYNFSICSFYQLTLIIILIRNLSVSIHEQNIRNYPVIFRV